MSLKSDNEQEVVILCTCLSRGNKLDTFGLAYYVFMVHVSVSLLPVCLPVCPSVCLLNKNKNKNKNLFLDFYNNLWTDGHQEATKLWSESGSNGMTKKV